MIQILFYQLLRFFSSLKLAVVLLLSLAVALAAGTIQESLHDPKVAHDTVYHTWWFAFLLTLLVINVAGAALTRLPWKRRHTGFVITHAGIILILIGSMMTLAFGKEGQMAIRVGQMSNTVLLDHQFLHFEIPGSGIDAVFPVNPRKNKSRILPLAPWSPVQAKITEIINKAKSVSKIKDDEKGSPGVLIHLSGMMGEINEWLVLGDPVRERLKIGPAEILLLLADSPEKLDFLINAIASNKQYSLPESDRNALWIIMGPEGKLYYRLKAKGEFAQRGPLYKSIEYRTGWMDFKFSLEDYKSSVAIEREYEPIPKGEVKDESFSALRLELARKGDQNFVWLELGEKKNVLVNGTEVKLNYFLEREPLPFGIKLQEFNVGRYEGTNNPMSYESLVEVNDFHKNKKFSHVIKMNHPLKYGGLKFYQAGFQEEEGVPRVSVFAVGKDPGIPIKYLGSIILIIGIGIQFFARKWLVGESKKENIPHHIGPFEVKDEGAITVEKSSDSQETVLIGESKNE